MAIFRDGTATPSRFTSALGPVVRVSNHSGDNAFLASVQLQRQFGSGLGLSASYTYSYVEDAFSVTKFMSGNILRDTPLDGSLEDRAVGTSFFSVPHRVSITGSVTLPLRSRFSLTYQGSSQAPYTYIVNGDVNADGVNQLGFSGGQDVLYVPRDVRPGGDINLVTWDDATKAFVPAPASEYAELDKFISNEECLDHQRGRIMARNSCRNAWFGQLDARLAVDLPTFRGGPIQLTADVTNLPALLHLPDFDPIWTTTYRATDSGESSVPLLELHGYNTVKQRGIYSLARPHLNSVDQVWNMQIGVRYSF